MKLFFLISILYILSITNTSSQVVLSANGAGDTYKLINSVLAPNYDVVEVPDCNHASFGRHIDEVFDTDLNKNVFRFFIHTENDNDRCKNFDRQRNEIKTYDKSPENLKGIEGEKVIYKWKMKIDANFKASSSFTHLHQLKSVDGDYASIPMYTLTARKGTPDKLELRQTNTNDQETLIKVDLSLLKGHWVEITEKIAFGNNETYSIKIERIDNQKVVLEYKNTNIGNWQQGAEFVRPKWGIYRSLNNVADLRYEEVLFADFSVEEVSTLSLNNLKANNQLIKTYPNPAKDTLHLTENASNNYDTILIFNVLGKQIDRKQNNNKSTVDVSNLKKGSYYFIFKKDEKIVSKNTVIIK
ncbi:T9SS type A sorting domain-containing protein [Polaribacter ponticola]|uniref:T9SS type A sorting domain-containing protein n=1 Tax=Polaribacter ponticola TaxID=2978475 RepID=A0ABT5S962_9FLAO|nr:T9SS type A sorting domain-containing protein [Polaribacter sp. MSW5]MDD7914647.1 T9SS type A sorting domain-containing protein [Polaribacter sp. MSW5]